MVYTPGDGVSDFISSINVTTTFINSTLVPNSRRIVSKVYDDDSIETQDISFGEKGRASVVSVKC